MEHYLFIRSGVLTHTTTQISLENTLCEITQIQRDNLGLNLNEEDREGKLTDTERELGVTRGQRWGNGELLPSSYRVSGMIKF